MEINGNVVLQTDNLQEFTKYAERLQHRATGRTTRMFFKGLAEDTKCPIYFVFHSRDSCHHGIRSFVEMLGNLGYEFKSNKAKMTVENFGKTYHFITRDQYYEPYNRYSRAVGHFAYFDEQ